MRTVSAMLAAALLLAADDVAAATVLDLQQGRKEERVDYSAPGHAGAVVRLVNLNANINAWYLLEVTQPGKPRRAYNLWNTYATYQGVHLDREAPGSLVLRDYRGDDRCALWGPKAGLPLEAARAARRPFQQLCGGRLMLKSATAGKESVKELATEFFRARLPGGERVITFLKNTLFQDETLVTAAVTLAAPGPTAQAAEAGVWPADARVAARFAGGTTPPGELGIRFATGTAGDAAKPTRRAMVVGKWYEAAAVPGVYVSQMTPEAAAEDVLASYPELVSRLDPVERQAAVYLAAFDLERFGLGFTLGTKNPGVEWSNRVPGYAGLAASGGLGGGPDGFAALAPLVATGVVSPALAPRVVATFVGGFKRLHSAFRKGPYAERNGGSHYGFVEDGVVLSRLNPGLATVYARKDGAVRMKSWDAADDAQLADVRYARQNGLPLVEPGAAPELPKPGDFINRWIEGNWSSDIKQHQRTLRTGLCLQESPRGRFLIFAYFSSATPKAMARVFQAYQCRYAMHLDMNMLEHTYLAVYHDAPRGLAVEHLTSAMARFDVMQRGKVLPRFLGLPDNRDFFFMYKKAED